MTDSECTEGLISSAKAHRFVRLSIAALSDYMARNLMEHAANKTPIINRKDISDYFCLRGAG